MTLEVRDAVDPLSTLKFWTDPESSKKEVVQYVCLLSPPLTPGCVLRESVLSPVCLDPTFCPQGP